MVLFPGAADVVIPSLRETAVPVKQGDVSRVYDKIAFASMCTETRYSQLAEGAAPLLQSAGRSASLI
jgi:hypothetical protein